jgi:YgiT-type zinc finger domain-containing protein
MLARIRKQAAEQAIRVTQHAHKEMDEEDITLDEVLAAIMNCQVLEDYPEHRRDPCCLLFGYTRRGRPSTAYCMYNGATFVTNYYGLRSSSSKVDEADTKETTMKCNIEGCPGEYEQREVVHTVRQGKRIIVIEHVPAEVCPICGDVLFTPETVRNIERLRHTALAPIRTVPLYDFKQAKSA